MSLLLDGNDSVFESQVAKYLKVISGKLSGLVNVSLKFDEIAHGSSEITVDDFGGSVWENFTSRDDRFKYKSKRSDITNPIDEQLKYGAIHWLITHVETIAYAMGGAEYASWVIVCLNDII